MLKYTKKSDMKLPRSGRDDGTAFYIVDKATLCNFTPAELDWKVIATMSYSVTYLQRLFDQVDALEYTVNM